MPISVPAAAKSRALDRATYANLFAAEASELRSMLPGLGPRVVGASWTPYDGHANPLRLLLGDTIVTYEFDSADDWRGRRAGTEPAPKDKK